MNPGKFIRLFAVFVVLGAAAGCPSSDSWQSNYNNDPAAVQQRLRQTVEDLAAFGEKQPGTEAGRQAGDYIFQRFEEVGLEDVHFETFTLPGYTINDSALTVTADGAPLSMTHDVFAYSGTGTVDATVVYVGRGHSSAYDGLDVAGLVVLVDRDPTFHRSSQYSLVIDHGGAAMLYVSQSPDNLIQIGTVAEPEDGLGAIPAVTVGSDDGRQIVDALDGGQMVRASLEVDATIGPVEGRNVVGWMYGSEPGGAYFLVGAHYDTWYTGSIDNGTGVAAVIETAEALAGRRSLYYGAAFVAYDGEEVGLFGGYDFLRKHVVVNQEPVVAVIHFDMPANGGDGTRLTAHTKGGGLADAVLGSGIEQLFDFVGGMDLVPDLFGGVIPTDIQGMYWFGVQGVMAVCDTPYYHTPEDTPDKIDFEFFARTMLLFVDMMEVLDGTEREDLEVHDPTVWKLDVTTEPSGADLSVTVTARDAHDVEQDGANVWIWVDVDDFTRTHRETALTGPDGSVSVIIPEAGLTAGQGGRWLHVTAGEDYPLAESITPLP